MRTYFYSLNGNRIGPLSLEELKDKNINEDTLVWYEGLNDWSKAKDLEELNNFISKTPPPLPEIEISQRNFFERKYLVQILLAFLSVGIFFYIYNLNSNKSNVFNHNDSVNDNNNKQNIITTSEAIKIAERKFKKFSPNIEIGDKGIQFTKTFTGDLNNDGLEEVVIYFVCTPKSGGNIIVGIEAAVYLNLGNTVKAVAGLSTDYPFHIQSIKDNKLIVIEEIYDKDDFPGFPSKGKTHYFVLNGDSLQEIVN